MGYVFPRLLCVVCLLLVVLPGCRRSNRGGSDSGRFPIEAGKYRILGIRTDANDHARAKQNAESAIINNPNLKCMVGLWAYNPPQILNAVEEAGKSGEIQIVGFDENSATLRGIEAGKIHGTIVQQPFLFGYKSVEYLAGIIREQPPEIPESQLIFIPHQTIRQDNVAEFQEEIARINAGEGTQPPHDRDDYDTSTKVKLGFLTNTVDPFWNLAEAGVRRAEPVFNAECDVYHPNQGTTEQQKRFVERKIGDGCQGLAISPIDPSSQTTLIDQAAETMVVICHDSDAPDSKRLFYIGTGNYLAGRAAGKLVKEAIPEGGDIMIFVGKMEVLNAQERSEGVIDELLDKPIPEKYAAYVE